MNFMNYLQDESTKTRTENGAIGYSTTGKALVDVNFKIPAYRTDKELFYNDLAKVLDEKDPYVFKYLFYLRDVRGGLGERDAFRHGLLQALRASKFSNEEIFNIIHLIPCYGRWDDLFIFVDTEYEGMAFALIIEQLATDEFSMRVDNSVSLLAKWMPSDNATSKRSRYIAHKLARYIGREIKDYRASLVALRKYLDVTEVKTCANEWNAIDYNKVSSNANIRYRNAFLKHDEERRREYLAALERGDKDVVIHSATNFPHDIVSKYTNNNNDYWGAGILPTEDMTLEALWKALPDLSGLNNTLVIRDGSGSMTDRINNTTTALDVADAITLYCAARCSSEYKDKFITFSSRPQFVSVTDKTSLHDKLVYLRKYDDCSNTNLEATFDLILQTAVTHKLSQADLPAQIMIVSDMEFDCARGAGWASSNDSTTLMETIDKKFAAAGYTMPKLVFWNVNSRTNTIPVKENAAGVVLVSGFSVQVINMVLSGKTDPYDAIIATIDTERYKQVPLAKF